MPSATQTSPNVARGTKYAEQVTAGQITACHWVKLACQRHLQDLDRFKGKDARFYFDPDAADRVCDIVQRFPHVKGIWATHRKHIELEPWQCFCLMNVFGWQVTETHTRRFRTVYIEVPRKNAKSTITSAVGLYMLACDGELGAYVVSAANSRDQAKLVFTDAQLMARKEPGFRARFGVDVLAHSITVLKAGSRFDALSAEHSNLDGLNIHAALIDELHAHPTRGLWDVLETATGSRAQPLIWAITTAGVNRASVCYDQRGHVIDILSGVVQDDSYFGIIYTIDDGDDPWAEESWIKANPNYGISIYPEHLKTQAARAQVMPSMQNSFLTKYLDVWVTAETAWLPAGAWEKCAYPALDIEDFRGQPCFIGIDLALRSDIAALVLAFPPDEGRDWWAVFGKYYLPEETVNRSENAHYQGWEAAGRLVATPGAITDFDYILDDLEQACTAHMCMDICIDPFDAGPLIVNIQKRGLKNPVEIRQNITNMSPAMVELEGLVLAQRLRHDGDPVLSWMQANTKCKRQAGDLIQPIKESDEKKIDGITALLMCIGRGLRYSSGAKADYEGRGLWII